MLLLTQLIYSGSKPVYCSQRISNQCWKVEYWKRNLVDKSNLNILIKLQKVFDPIVSYLKPILDVDQWPIKADSSFGSHAWLGLQCTTFGYFLLFYYCRKGLGYIFKLGSFSQYVFFLDSIGPCGFWRFAGCMQCLLGE